MSYDEILNKVMSLTANTLGLGIEEVSIEQPFTEMGADDLDQIELIMEIEKEFKISIDDDDAEQLTNVQKVVDHVQEKLQ